MAVNLSGCRRRDAAHGGGKKRGIRAFARRRRGLGGSAGFTLLELLVALCLSVITLSAVYVVYLSQQKTSLVQEAVAATQQNLRTAMYFLERDIRMAGCNPSGSAPAGIITASSSSLRFTMDVRGGEGDGLDNDHDGLVDEPDEFYDGDCLDAEEDVAYSLGDSDGNGVSDLLRNGVPVAQNVEVMDLVYLRDDGGIAVLPEQVRYVEVSLVARTGQIDRDFTDTTNYVNQSGTVILAAPGDHFRRRSLSVRIKCRNTGS